MNEKNQETGKKHKYGQHWLMLGALLARDPDQRPFSMTVANAVLQNNPDMWLALGRYFFDNGDLDNAIKAFEEANTPEAHYQIGIVYISIKKFEKAEKAWLEAKTGNAYFGLSLISKTNRDLKKAKEYMDLAMDPYNRHNTGESMNIMKYFDNDILMEKLDDVDEAENKEVESISDEKTYVRKFELVDYRLDSIKEKAQTLTHRQDFNKLNYTLLSILEKHEEHQEIYSSTLVTIMEIMLVIHESDLSTEFQDILDINSVFFDYVKQVLQLSSEEIQFISKEMDKYSKAIQRLLFLGIVQFLDPEGWMNVKNLENYQIKNEREMNADLVRFTQSLNRQYPNSPFTIELSERVKKFLLDSIAKSSSSK